jgi:hypothetical protein
VNGRFKSAIEGVVEWGIYRPLWPMVGLGVGSLPAVFAGLLLGWDWLVTTGFVLGYLCVAWGLFAVAFVVVFGRWIDELQFPRL